MDKLLKRVEKEIADACAKKSPPDISALTYHLAHMIRIIAARLHVGKATRDSAQITPGQALSIIPDLDTILTDMNLTTERPKTG